MPNYTLIHGGLKKDGRNYVAGEVVELDLAQAAHLNRKGETVRLAEVVEAEKKALETADKAKKEAEKKAAEADKKGGAK